MLIGMEIAMLVMGLIALIKGKMTWSKNKVVTGTPARLAGLVLLAPLPLAFCVGFVLSAGAVLNGKATQPKDIQTTLILLELGIAVGCFLVALVIGLSNGRPPESLEGADGLPPLRRSDVDYGAAWERPTGDGVQQAPRSSSTHISRDEDY